MKFKIGDRVEGIGEVDCLDVTGQKGTVKCFETHSDTQIGIEWDDNFDNDLHDLNGKCKGGYGWFVNEKDIKPITDKPKLTKPNSSDVCTVLDEFINDRRMFTKYDVTKQLRHNGFMAIHREVRNLVEQELELPDDYDKDNLSSFGNPEVYIPEENSVSQYDPNDIPEFDVNVSNVKILCKKHSNIKKVSPTKSLFDVRDRYSVKAKVTRDAGFSVGDTIFILAKNNIIEVIDRPKTNAKKATVDCYYNIRIPKVVFEKAFNCVPMSINVTADKNIIEIKEN